MLGGEAARARPDTLSFGTIPYAKVGTIMGLAGGQCINKKVAGKGDVIVLTSTPGTAGKAEQDGAVLKWLKKTAPGAKVVQTVVQTDLPKSQKAISAALADMPAAPGAAWRERARAASATPPGRAVCPPSRTYGSRSA